MNFSGPKSTRNSKIFPVFFSNATTIIFLFILLLNLLQFLNGAPAFCRTCRGSCKNETLDVNATDSSLNNDLIQDIVDSETAIISEKLYYNNSNIDDDSLKKSTSAREKRASYVERHTCSSRFQLEILVIPISILMIPMALCGLLLCVFCCGPKESRGKVPDKMFGVRLSQKQKKSVEANGYYEDDELEYNFRAGYVQRKDSKKTRFATNIQFFEAARRESSVTVASGDNFMVSNGHEMSHFSNNANETETVPPRIPKKISFSDSTIVKES